MVDGLLWFAAELYVLALGGIELHIPFFLPFLKRSEVFLTFVCLVGCRVYDSVVSEESNLASDAVREVVYETRKRAGPMTDLALQR